MRKTLAAATAAAVAALAGCASDRSTPHAPIDNVRYSALGENPFWMVTIGDDAIALTLSADVGAASNRLSTHRFPRTLPRTVDGVRSWQSGEGTQVITVEARAGPCTGSRGRVYADHVRVRLSGRELNGCGGREVEGPGG